jgi:hypothetical protein
MSGGDPSGALRDIRILFGNGRLADLTDRQLLEGFVSQLPHEEAARQLGCPVGTVESRLSRGWQRLRDRLVRRGLAPAAAAMSTEMAREVSAAIPAALIKHSARFVTSSPAAGAVPAAVTALAEGVIQMMWLARLKPLVAVAAAVMLVTAGVAVQGRQGPAPQREREQAKTAPLPAVAAVPALAANQALAREQLALIDKALEILHTLAQNARVGVSDASFSVWGRRKLETIRKTGAGKAEIVAALEEYINTLKQEEATAEVKARSAQATQVDVYDARFRRLEAEMFLNEEKAR